MIRLTISRKPPDELILEWKDAVTASALTERIRGLSGTKLEEIKNEFLRAVWGNSIDDLVRAGTQLWALLPLEIASKLNNANMVVPAPDLYLEISKDLLDIPWELLHNGQEFLGEYFNVGKTVTGTQNLWNAQSRDLQVPLKTLILSNPDGNQELKQVYDECLAVRASLEQYPDQFDLVTRTGRVHKKLLEVGEIQKYDLVLFFGHTQYIPKKPSSSGWRFAESVYGEADIRTACNFPVPFCAGAIVNSCQLPNEPTWQSQQASLCNAFLQAGVSFFIGTYWHIPDKQAAQFSAALLKELIIEQKSLGEALRLVRNQSKQALSWRHWASYTLYGDPTMKIIISPGLAEPVKAEAAATRAQSLMPEERVAQYTILTRIEEDDPYHVLHTACDPEGHNVVLGVSYIQDPEIATQELGRMQKLMALNHPNLVRILAAEQLKAASDEETGKFFIVHESFENAITMEQALTESQTNPEKHISPERARDYLVQLCDAVQAIHSLGYYHGNLTTRNILITPDDLVKVNPKNALTSPGSGGKVKGGGASEVPYAALNFSQIPELRMPYAAPEQITRHHSDQRSDIWALGVIAYELLSGGYLFGAGDLITDPQTGWPESVFASWPPDFTNVLPEVTDTLLKAIDLQPDRRFKSVADLVKALENPDQNPVAEQALTELEQEIYNYFRSGCALLALIAEEEDRALRSLSSVAQRLDVPLYQWSSTLGLNVPGGTVPRNEVEVLKWFARDLEQPGILVLKDFHPYLNRIEVQRWLNDWYTLRHQSQLPVKTIVVTSPVMILTETLERRVAMLTFPPPDHFEISRMLEQKIQVLPREKQPPMNQLRDMAWQSRGLALREIERVMDQTLLEPDRSLAHSFFGKLTEAKGEIIRKTGLLEFYEPGITLDALGGLDPLRTLIRSVELALHTRNGLPIPKGWLLVGVPGAGKSLTAQAIAGQLQLPLMRLDMGRIYTALQGGAENNMNQAIELCTRLSPVILWVDEIEKGLSGMTSAGAGGPMSRVLGILLSWMQERSTPVFIVATANDVNLGFSSPELFRPGRFDAILFFDRPGSAGRREIFRVLFNKYSLKSIYKSEHLDELVENSQGATGVEIEQALVDAIYNALSQSREDPTREDILLSLKKARDFWIENTALGHTRNQGIRAIASMIGAVKVTI
jgi:ATP-dependent 26S proteasome regulatory subunit/serine/threonine protein kinase